MGVKEKNLGVDLMEKTEINGYRGVTFSNIFFFFIGITYQINQKQRLPVLSLKELA